jgi:hypothetical protein
LSLAERLPLPPYPEAAASFITQMEDDISHFQARRVIDRLTVKLPIIKDGQDGKIV